MIMILLFCSDDLRDHQVLVQLQQSWILCQSLVLLLQLFVDLPLEHDDRDLSRPCNLYLELGQQLHQLVLDLVPVRHLGSLTSRVDKVENCAVAIVKNYLQLDLRLALRTDLL